MRYKITALFADDESTTFYLPANQTHEEVLMRDRLQSIVLRGMWDTQYAPPGTFYPGHSIVRFTVEKEPTP